MFSTVSTIDLNQAYRIQPTQDKNEVSSSAVHGGGSHLRKWGIRNWTWPGVPDFGSLRDSQLDEKHMDLVPYRKLVCMLYLWLTLGRE